ncbi:APC family permease [Pseudomonas brassicacearum]|uniref:APC family permease n=1 Tax=Pseudomonas brassicacearum TaxID=930166 RepID=UPI00087D698B|nr:APC family permease [Pseudomonas brassicacearum]KAB0528520.1 APC family permease [Pseudomonas brassicacearum subsp. brassicacearum]NJP59262.1 APC family permease [Pseudomonas brassicacearum]SDP21289.1 Amino acid transporter [Pseudomonas brassicacearum]
MNDVAAEGTALDDLSRTIGSRQPSTNSARRMERVLGLPSLVLFGLAYMVPLTVFTTYGLVTQATSGHLPAAYVVTLITMLFTAYSYGRMAASLPYAGSAYAYASSTFGGKIGFMVGWVLLLDYLFIPMICYLVIGIYMAQYFPAVPMSVWICGSILGVLVLNVLGIKLLAKVNFALIGVQIVFIVVFIAASIVSISDAPPVSFSAPFFSPDINFQGLLSGAATLCLSFLGFDAVSTLSEETRDPARNLPRAIMLCTLLSGFLFILIAYTGHLAYPDWRAFQDVDSASLQVIQHVGGQLLSAFFTAIYVAGCFACAMTAQASVSRILFAMGRNGVLSKRVFGVTSKRFGTPVSTTVLVSLISLTALLISLDLASTMISFGALTAFSFVNLSVIKHFLWDKGVQGPRAILCYGFIPLVGLILTLWLWTSLSSTTFEVGLAWLGGGLFYLLWLTRGFRRPTPQLHQHDD